MKNPLGISLGLRNAHIVREYAAAGFEVAEISLPARPYEEVREFTLSTFEEMKACGMKLWSVHLPFSRELDISNPDEAGRLAALEALFPIVDLAGEIGAQTLIIHGSSEPNEDFSRADRMVACAASLRALQERAGSMKLALENLPRSCIGRSSDEIVALAPNCAGVCFDVNHLLIESHEVFMAPVAPLVISTHLSDYDGIDERHWLPGMGIVPWKQIYDTLLSVGYEGPFLFELRLADDGNPYPPADVVAAWNKVIEA